MQSEKKWYESRTVWGGLVALGAALAGLAGLQVPGPAQEALTTAVLDTATAIGALVAIYGRLAADKTLR